MRVNEKTILWMETVPSSSIMERFTMANERKIRKMDLGITSTKKASIMKAYGKMISNMVREFSLRKMELITMGRLFMGKSMGLDSFIYRIRVMRRRSHFTMKFGRWGS